MRLHLLSLGRTLKRDGILKSEEAMRLNKGGTFSLNGLLPVRGGDDLDEELVNAAVP